MRVPRHLLKVKIVPGPWTPFKRKVYTATQPLHPLLRYGFPKLTERIRKPNAQALVNAMENAGTLHFPKPTKRIGTNSANGAVFATNDPKYVIKLVPQRNRREAEIQKVLSNHGIAPPVYKKQTIPITRNRSRAIFGTASKEITLILMNHLGGKGQRFESANTYFSKYPNNERTKNLVRAKVNKMHNLGILHGDLHGENFYIIRDPKTGKVVDVMILDFGRAKFLPRAMRSTSIDNLIRQVLPASNRSRRHPSVYRGTSGVGRRRNRQVVENVMEGY